MTDSLALYQCNWLICRAEEKFLLPAARSKILADKKDEAADNVHVDVGNIILFQVSQAPNFDTSRLI